MSSKAEFYVYEHWRPDKDECFYVGKGYGARSSLRHRRNKHHAAIVGVLRRGGVEPEVRIVAEGLTESSAFAIECERIAFWRGVGAKLSNLTSGGEGVSDPSEEVRERIGSGQRGKKRPPDHCARLSESHRLRMTDPDARARCRNRPETIANNPLLQKGRVVSEDTKRRLSKSLMGRKLSAEHCASISAGNTGREVSLETRSAQSVAAKRRFEDPHEREKISNSRKGIVFSDEHRRNLSLSHMGKSSPKPPVSQEARDKISHSLKGRKRSPEAIAKHRETLARRRENTA